MNPCPPPPLAIHLHISDSDPLSKLFCYLLQNALKAYAQKYLKCNTEIYFSEAYSGRGAMGVQPPPPGPMKSRDFKQIPDYAPG